MAGGTYAHFSPGASGAGGKNAGYVTREGAVRDGRDGVLLHNLPADVTEGVAEAGSYGEARDHLTAYARTQEACEVRRHGGRAGEPRTHYRAVLSFERDVTTERAKAMTAEWLGDQFGGARAFAVVHRNTDHAHVHVWIDARGVDGKKLHFSRSEYRGLDVAWNRVYSREMGRDEREHLDKKAETREYRRARAEGRPAERPARDAKRGPGRSAERAATAEGGAPRGATAGPGARERLDWQLGRIEVAGRVLGERRAEAERAVTREDVAARQVRAGMGRVYRDPGGAFERFGADAEARGEGTALDALARDPGRYGPLRGRGVGPVGDGERRAARAAARDLGGAGRSYFDARREGGTAREQIAGMGREQVQLRALHARTVRELSGMPGPSLGGGRGDAAEAEVEHHAEFVRGAERDRAERSGEETREREAERGRSQGGRSGGGMGAVGGRRLRPPRAARGRLRLRAGPDPGGRQGSALPTPAQREGTRPVGRARGRGERRKGRASRGSRSPCARGCAQPTALLTEVECQRCHCAHQVRLAHGVTRLVNCLL